MLKIYNTLSKQKEEFTPIEKGKVRFYQCGPTVYWTQHIGNMRAVVMADLVNRSLKYLGYGVNFVRNYTDVGHLTSDADEGEDKMEKRAKIEKKSPEEIAQKYTDIYEKDIQKLNTLFPTYNPKATEYIQEMQNMIQVLLDKGFAYKTELAIYFDSSKAEDYYRLSKQKQEENITGAGTGEVLDPDKKYPADSVIWFFKKGVHKNALQTWDSPWGVGFPGWHIECSAMSKSLLGDTLDLKMGGIEHIPTHHTNEIAYSENANEAEYVHYWIHNEHLLVNNGKMSKSGGTSYSVAEIEKKGFDPLALRYFFLQAHYRSKQNFTWEALKSAQNGYINLKKQVAGLRDNASFFGKFFKSKPNSEFQQKFIKAISDDFNIPQAFALVSEVLKSNLSDKEKLATILDFDKVFGLGLSKIKKEKVDSKIPVEVQKILDERQKARENKDWQKSDELRNKLKELNYEISDTDGGQKIIKNKQLRS